MTVKFMLRPTTITEYGQKIISSRDLGWALYKAIKELGANGLAALGGDPVNPDYANLAVYAGYDGPEPAEEYIKLLALAAAQLQAETIDIGDGNGPQKNAMRELLHRI